MSTIATEIGRSVSTVSRELSRNGTAPGRGGKGKYAPYAAQQRAELRGRRPKASQPSHQLGPVRTARLRSTGLRVSDVTGPWACCVAAASLSCNSRER